MGLEGEAGVGLEGEAGVGLEGRAGVGLEGLAGVGLEGLAGVGLKGLARVGLEGEAAADASGGTGELAASNRTWVSHRVASMMHCMKCTSRLGKNAPAFPAGLGRLGLGDGEVPGLPV